LIEPWFIENISLSCFVIYDAIYDYPDKKKPLFFINIIIGRSQNQQLIDIKAYKCNRSILLLKSVHDKHLFQYFLLSVPCSGSYTA